MQSQFTSPPHPIVAMPCLRPEAEMHRVAVYCRAATRDRGRIADALDVQEQVCRDYAEARGWRVVGVFRDRAAGNATTRPQLMSLTAAVTAGMVDAVLVTDWLRLARDRAHAAILQADWAAADVAVIIVNEGGVR